MVHKAFVRFRGLLYELGLSGHQTEVIAIKLEVDTNPPCYAGLTTTPLQRYVPLNLHHHDQATLFAGKLGAVLQRMYLKGRDIYDLWWYLEQDDWSEPNLAYLNQSLKQTGWEEELLTLANWRTIVQQKVASLNWPDVLEDVGSFMIESISQQDFNKTRLLELLDDR